MSNIDPIPNQPVRHRRNAALFGGGALILGLGIAAGMMLGRQPSEEALVFPPPGAGLPATEQAEQMPSPVQEASPDTVQGSEKRRSASSSTSRQRASDGQQTSERKTSEVQARAVCSYCGVIETVTPVPVQGQNTGVGAVAGGVLGGVAGNQVGKGGGNTAATVLGVIGGGIAGHEIEKRHRTDTVYRVKVRMDDGTVKTFTRRQDVAPGSRVEVQGGELKLLNADG